MQTYVENLASMLREGRFTEITLDQWESIILSIIVEDMEADAAYKNQKPPAWISGVPRVHFTITLGLNTRDGGEVVAAIMFFEETLPTAVRFTLSEALTRFVKNAYETLKQIGYDKNNVVYEQAKTLVDQGLSISSLLNGAIRADVVEEMALDSKFHNRWAAAGNLLGQNFRNSASPAFWEKLEGQVSRAPELAPQVMHYRLDEHNEFAALRVLKHVPKEPEGNVIRLVERALKKTRQVTGWDEHVRSIFGELPPWVLEMVKENVELDPILQEVIDLLEASPT